MARVRRFESGGPQIADDFSTAKVMGQILQREPMTHGGRVDSLVYIILLNWNGWQDTLKCMASLDRLEYPNYQVLVVDNRSTDDSVARIRSAHPDVPIIQTEENLGFSGGNNVGVRRALEQGAEYIWLLNNDTIVDSRSLTAMVELAEEDPTIGAVGSVLYHMDEPKEVQNWGGGMVNTRWGLTRYYKSRIREELLHFITGASLLIRREVLDDIGLLDETFFMYWEDADFGLRLRKANWRLAVAEDSHVCHKPFGIAGKNSILTTTYFSSSAVLFFKKHASIPLVPIFVGTGGRAMKRLLRRDLNGLKAVLRSAFGRPG